MPLKREVLPKKKQETASVNSVTVTDAASVPVMKEMTLRISGNIFLKLMCFVNSAVTITAAVAVSESRKETFPAAKGFIKMYIAAESPSEFIASDGFRKKLPEKAVSSIMPERMTDGL